MTRAHAPEERLDHLGRSQLPAALAALHLRSTIGTEVEVVVSSSTWDPVSLSDTVTGGGFEMLDRRTDPPVAAGPHQTRLRLRRVRTLADTVDADLGLLVCGLNPSLPAADAGVGFVSPSNRFWAAACEAGLVSRDRDPLHALAHHRVGMTDLVKRATARASELRPDEYRAGLDRLTRQVQWLEPGAVCFVGLAGWRAARDRHATAGWQSAGLGTVPVYLMPSTSGLNASSRRADLVDHLRAAQRPPG